MQYPSTTGVGDVYAGKVAPLVVPATALFAKINADEPFTLDSGTGRGSVTNPSTPPAGAKPTTAPTSSAPSSPLAGRVRSGSSARLQTANPRKKR